MKLKLLFLTAFTCFLTMAVRAQLFDLQHELATGKIITYDRKVVPITDGKYNGISTDRLMWLKDVVFSEGTIEADLRGKDIDGQSFLGIAFHGVDSTTYDAIYFRPFNFRSANPVKKIHAVQYISHPVYTWSKLREERNGEFEKGIVPAPDPSQWFHVRIVVKEKEITVFVNDDPNPSLTVQKLNTRTSGHIGIWAFALPGDFASLRISK